jgi:hypothetical protein
VGSHPAVPQDFEGPGPVASSPPDGIEEVRETVEVEPAREGGRHPDHQRPYHERRQQRTQSERGPGHDEPDDEPHDREESDRTGQVPLFERALPDRETGEEGEGGDQRAHRKD